MDELITKATRVGRPRIVPSTSPELPQEVLNRFLALAAKRGKNERIAFLVVPVIRDGELFNVFIMPPDLYEQALAKGLTPLEGYV